MNGAQHSIDDLEDAVLEVIFAHACAVKSPGHERSTCSQLGGLAPTYRHQPALPRVCRRWNGVYTQSTVLWEETRVDWAVVQQQGQASPQGSVAACLGAARWLAARLPFVRRLVLRGCCAEYAAILPQVLPAGLASPRLREAQFLEAAGNQSHLLALLKGCPSLQAVTMSCLQCLPGPASTLVVQGEALTGLASLPSIKSLYLHVDKLSGSQRELGQALSGLTRLALRCRLESAALAPEFLEGLSQLRRLELGNVRLAQFTPRLAQALAHCTYLHCSDVMAARPRRRAGMPLWEGLRHLASLRQLSLEDQCGAGMPAAALACSGLQGLTLLRGCASDWPLSLHRLAGEGGCLGRLQSLSLCSLRLSGSIPPAIWRQLAPALTSLTWHHVTRLPPVGGQMQELLQAVEVPAELSHLANLSQLRLEYAQLDSVPAAVQALTNLTGLYLEGNRISTLPEGRYLTGLRQLSLANNALAELPEGLSACSSLGELSLVDNADMAVTPEAAEKLAAALTQLCCLRLSVAPVAAHAGAGTATAAGAAANVDAAEGAGGGGEADAAHLQGLRRLVQLLGPRLVCTLHSGARDGQGGGGGQMET